MLTLMKGDKGVEMLKKFCDPVLLFFFGELNGHFCIMLNQAAGDRQILAKQLNISPHQLSYVTHSGEGEGLLFFGNVILPFVDRFPTDLELYRIMTTKLGEVSEGAQK